MSEQLPTLPNDPDEVMDLLAELDAQCVDAQERYTNALRNRGVALALVGDREDINRSELADRLGLSRVRVMGIVGTWRNKLGMPPLRPSGRKIS
jgi:hypothetical protein